MMEQNKRFVDEKKLKKSTRFIIGLAFILSLLMFSLIFMDFLALSDISKDYVSRSVLESMQVGFINNLPDWSSAELEWSVVKFSMILKFLIMVVILVALGKATKFIRI